MVWQNKKIVILFIWNERRWLLGIVNHFDVHIVHSDIVVFIISYSFVTRVSWCLFQIIRQICRLVIVSHTAVISA